MEQSMRKTKKCVRTAREHYVGQITHILSLKNDPESLKKLLELAYGELHGIAIHKLRSERPGHTLQPTALVNQICLGFLEEGAVFKNRRHFFGAVSKAMRRVLVDSSRRRRARKRGGGWRRVDFREAERIGFEQPSQLLEFDHVLKRLELAKPAWGETAELRVFGGLTSREAAAVLGVAESTVRRRWAKARTWLREALASSTIAS